jgi:hypothetical protein
MESYRLAEDQLWTILDGWSSFIPREVRLVACGGTALTIHDIKESTKDVDFLVPVKKEYEQLLKVLIKLGYRNVTTFGWARNDPFIFDLYPGKRVYMTELLSSPLKKGNSIRIRKFSKISVSALNDYDLITSKIFRSSSADIQDCLALIKHRGKSFDFKRLEKRFKETAQYELNPERMISNLRNLLSRVKDGN